MRWLRRIFRFGIFEKYIKGRTIAPVSLEEKRVAFFPSGKKRLFLALYVTYLHVSSACMEEMIDDYAFT
jgi:hypothetical protein